MLRTGINTGPEACSGKFSVPGPGPVVQVPDFFSPRDSPGIPRLTNLAPVLNPGFSDLESQIFRGIPQDPAVPALAI